MPFFGFLLVGFGAAVILFPDLLSILVGLAFVCAGGVLLALWYASRKAIGDARKNFRVGGVEILFPGRK